MKYRKFGKSDFMVSAFGMGCMRMPMETRADGTRGFDHAESIRMIHRAIEGGVNYFDAANSYGDGECEEVLGEALAIGGRRDKVHITTKIHPHVAPNEDVLLETFERECRRLQTDHIDCYLVHQLNDSDRFERFINHNMLPTMIKLKEQGRIGGIGFSYHGNAEGFKRCLDYYDWDMCQPQFNILDINRQATVDGIRYAGQRGIPVVVMEPLKGGSLANVPQRIQDIYDSYPIKHTPVEWGFRFVADFPEVACILSGVSTMEQLEDNLRIFDILEPNMLSQQEKDLIYNVKATFDSMIAVPCTACRYCMPCPQDVDIPRIFSIYNDASIKGDFSRAKHGYSRITDRRVSVTGKTADACVECGLCEAACPQHIPVMEKLKEAHAKLT